jgi:hypothetical protein
VPQLAELIASSPAPPRCAANSREYSRTGSHVPSTRDGKRSASVSGRPTARRSRRCTERIAWSIASSRSGTGRPRALRLVLVGTMVSRPFTSTRARRMCSTPGFSSMSDQRSDGLVDRVSGPGDRALQPAHCDPSATIRLVTGMLVSPPGRCGRLAAVARAHRAA